jgi:hypothetical protein
LPTRSSLLPLAASLLLLSGIIPPVDRHDSSRWPPMHLETTEKFPDQTEGKGSVKFFLCARTRREAPQ